MDKKANLQKLRYAVIRKYFVQNWQEVWFFPSCAEVPGVPGFMGTDPIFFVSINPSFGTFPSKADLFYYHNLKKQGFQNAHLTDAFKVKQTMGQRRYSKITNYCEKWKTSSRKKSQLYGPG